MHLCILKNVFQGSPGVSLMGQKGEPGEPGHRHVYGDTHHAPKEKTGMSQISPLIRIKGIPS